MLGCFATIFPEASTVIVVPSGMTSPAFAVVAIPACFAEIVPSSSTVTVVPSGLTIPGVVSVAIVASFCLAEIVPSALIVIVVPSGLTTPRVPTAATVGSGSFAEIVPSALTRMEVPSGLTIPATVVVAVGTLTEPPSNKARTVHTLMPLAVCTSTRSSSVITAAWSRAVIFLVSIEIEDILYSSLYFQSATIAKPRSSIRSAPVSLHTRAVMSF